MDVSDESWLWAIAAAALAAIVVLYLLMSIRILRQYQRGVSAGTGQLR
jgi:type VI protein secretion system component VasF